MMGTERSAVKLANHSSVATSNQLITDKEMVSVKLESPSYVVDPDRSIVEKGRSKVKLESPSYGVAPDKSIVEKESSKVKLESSNYVVAPDRSITEKERSTVIKSPADNAVPGTVPTEENSSRRTARTRVVNVLKRLKKSTPIGLQRRFSRLATSSLARSDEGQPEDGSVVSGSTDIVCVDDSSSSDERNCAKRQNGEPTLNSKTFHIASSSAQSKMPSSPITHSNPADDSVSESLGLWFDAFCCLAKSTEMDAFLDSSNKLAASAAQKSIETAMHLGETVVHTALLPVTLPLHVTASATGLVFHTGTSALHFFCDNLVPLVINHSMKVPPNQLLSKNVNPNANKTESGLKPETKNTPESTKPKSTTKQLNDGYLYGDEFLDRLRLDTHLYTTNGGSDDVSCAVSSFDTKFLGKGMDPLVLTNAETSKFLLRVDDIDVNFKEKASSDSEVHACFLDLDKDFSDDKLTCDALEQLTQRCMEIHSSNDAFQDKLPEPQKSEGEVVNSIRIKWKPVGQTKKDYKRLNELSKSKFYDELCDRVCAWSGKYVGKKYHGSDNPFFMAQGVVEGSPSDILDLLWDSKRTNEYNKHCTKREDIFSVVDDKAGATNEAFYGAKIIDSDTKVPFTSMTVHLSALMSAKLLGKGPEDGFIIISRSLSRGPKGHHSKKTQGLCRGSNNEVIIGINIMRPVPGRRGFSDLISISQVDASILPPFLKSRVGIMAVEDFFKNTRISLRDRSAS
mmetsp:Transcript_103757/g.211751  ORF Transcript_103757/g.211751 Transcript_103757/m.211751 type:complete len:738 (-) Transcript_103757:2371-4584(-)